MAQQLLAKGLRVDCARGPSEAREIMAHVRHDLALLDLSTPSYEAKALLADRQAGRLIPMIALIPVDALAKCKPGLLQRADDWVPKPVAMSELMARINAVLHRRRFGGARAHRAGALIVSADAQQVSFAGAPVALSMRERAALAILVRHLAHPVPRARLDAAIYGPELPPSPNATEALMSRLRRALKSAGCPARITAVRGIGWRLTMPDTHGGPH
ncbi:MAG: response regulator transcription factor [Pseudomonadota bacterium]